MTNEQRDERQAQATRRRLRGRNLAVLAALAGMVGLVYFITMARLETGTQRALEEAAEEESSSWIETGLKEHLA